MPISLNRDLENTENNNNNNNKKQKKKKKNVNQKLHRKSRLKTNKKSRLNDLLKIDNPYFEQTFGVVCPIKTQLNKTVVS